MTPPSRVPRADFTKRQGSQQFRFHFSLLPSSFICKWSFHSSILLQTWGGCTHMCVPASSAKNWSYSGQNAPPIWPLLSGLTSKELSLGFKNIQRPGAEFHFHSSCRAMMEKECFFHLPNILPFQCLLTADRVSQQEPGDDWLDLKPRDIALLCGPRAQSHLCLLSTTAPCHLGLPVWGISHWMGPSLTQL